jgi:hypothetical protein
MNASTATLSPSFEKLQEAALGLSAEDRFHLTHVLLQSIDETASMPSQVEERWVDFERRVSDAVNNGEMPTVDAFDALKLLRKNLLLNQTSR